MRLADAADGRRNGTRRVGILAGRVKNKNPGAVSAFISGIREPDLSPPERAQPTRMSTSLPD